MALWWILGIVVLIYIVTGIKVVKQYERGVRFTLGKYTNMIGPGLQFLWPIFQTWQRIDIRIKTVDVPDQDAITKDNVSIKVNAVLYYKVSSAEKAVIEVEDYEYAVSQLAQTTMRNVVGEVSLDDLLSDRDEVSAKIQLIVDKATDPWGIHVQAVELKHVELPEDMKRVIGKEAEADREKRAVIIKSSGEVTAATNLAKAAGMLSKSPGALHLRTLSTLNDLSSDQSNTVIFAVPLEILRAFERMGVKKK
ncbi:MAG: slipin family protein [Candidatus Woesearchaeota archaeon]